jgi:hypothetical protein
MNEKREATLWHLPSFTKKHIQCVLPWWEGADEAQSRCSFSNLTPRRLVEQSLRSVVPGWHRELFRTGRGLPDLWQWISNADIFRKTPVIFYHHRVIRLGPWAGHFSGPSGCRAVMVVPRAGAGWGSPSVQVGRSPSVPGLLIWSARAG